MKPPRRKIDQQTFAVLVKAQQRSAPPPQVRNGVPTMPLTSNTASPVNTLSIQKDTYKGGGFRMESATSSASGQLMITNLGLSAWNKGHTLKLMYYDAPSGVLVIDPSVVGGSLSGDITGSSSATVLNQIQGRKLLALSPVSGDVISFHSSNQWLAQVPQFSLLQDTSTASITDATALVQKIGDTITIPAGALAVGDILSWQLICKTSVSASSQQQVTVGLSFAGQTVVSLANAFNIPNSHTPWHFASVLAYAVSATNNGTNMDVLFNTFTGSIDASGILSVDESTLPLAVSQMGRANIIIANAIDTYFTGRFTMGNFGITVDHILTKVARTHAPQ